MSGSGVVGYTVKVYDGATLLGSTVVTASGTWSYVASLSASSHTLTATQTSTAISGVTYTSGASATTTVAVYAIPSAPSISSTANGTWSTIVWLGVGTHTLTATQSPAAGLESAPSGSRVVTVLWG